ncbi:MAG TPA: 50S ribosomal protein L9 [Polyangiaceae bacterium]|jgi:large subunit ribosomal protein L9
MPANIQVILQQDVQKLGKSGELVRVRPGFARNYLLPRQLAVTATSAAVRHIEHEKVVATAKAEKAKKEAQTLAAQIEALTIKLTLKAGDDGRLFGSVTSKDVENAVKAQTGGVIAIDRKKMHLPEAIKQVGAYAIPVKLVSDVSATLKVEVFAK